MKDHFYGWEEADVTPLHEKYKVKDPRELYDLLSEIWCVETCATRLRPKWSKANKTLGQCSVTAFLAQDIFGGEVRGIPTESGGIHCYNVVDGHVFDLTSEQFGKKQLTYAPFDPVAPDALQDRAIHFAFGDKKERYEVLLKKLDEAMADPKGHGEK